MELLELLEEHSPKLPISASLVQYRQGNPFQQKKCIKMLFCTYTSLPWSCNLDIRSELSANLGRFLTSTEVDLEIFAKELDFKSLGILNLVFFHRTVLEIITWKKGKYDLRFQGYDSYDGMTHSDSFDTPRT